MFALTLLLLSMAADPAVSPFPPEAEILEPSAAASIPG